MTKEQKLMEIIKGVGRLDESKVDYLYNFMQGFASDKEERIIPEENKIYSERMSANIKMSLEANSFEALQKDLKHFEEIFDRKGEKSKVVKIKSLNIESNTYKVNGEFQGYRATVEFEIELNEETVKAMNEGKAIF